MTRTSARRVSPGNPHALGVSVAGDGVNVAVWAPDAAGVDLCVFHAGPTGDVEERIPLADRHDGVWHAHVAGLGPGTRYGFRAAGPDALVDEGTSRFAPAKLLLDPYATGLDAPVRWHPWQSGLDPHDSAPVVPKCVVTGVAPGPDPAANRPRHARTDLIVYETHLRGATARHPDIPAHVRGTYLGFAHPAMVRHLVDLGVTAVEFLPLQAFVDDQHVLQRGLTNYWGYQPVVFRAPEPRYAVADADLEFRRLVYDLHEAGIEVILDVVFNHTGEGDERGPTLSCRGLNDAGYYRLQDGGRRYVDDTGTGNTLAVDRPMVLRLIMDSLRHFAERYGVDGFRFDLAATLGRTARGFDPSAAFFQAIAQDPVLAPLKLFAEPWDVGPDGYQLGNFPAPWSEWNDEFRDAVRRGWRGDPLSEGEVAAALLGSAHRFEHDGRDATASLNFVTAHDGFTLMDLVSHREKRNWLNLEENRDGHDANFSDDLGVDGPSTDPHIVEGRRRRRAAMLATLLVSQGIPMLLAGDELGNRQGGNNNAYAQDNEVGWVDWAAADPDFLDLVRRLIAVRRAHPALRQGRFLHGHPREDGALDVRWRLADGREPTVADWENRNSRCVLVEVRGAASAPRGPAANDAVLVVLNFGGDRLVHLPAPDAGVWRVEVDTARPALVGPAPAELWVLGQSVIVCALDRDLKPGAA